MLKNLAPAWALALACALAVAPAAAQNKKIAAPAPTIPVTGLAFGGVGEDATLVTPATPFPTICVSGCSATGAGTATAEPPTLTEGQASGLSFDLSGGLRVSGGGGGGSGGPTSIADGADITQGARGDAAWAGTGSGSITAILKAIRLGQTVAQPVTGTFWQATQPVSAVSLPLPSGAATSAAQTTGNGSLASIDTKLTGVATAAAQATGNNSLAAIDTKLGAGINVTCVSGCGGGGGGSGDASAANQLTQIGLLGDIDTTLGGTLTVALPTGASTLAAQTDVQVTAGAVKANRGVIYDASGNPVDWTAPVPVYVAARNQGGCTKYGYQSAATNNATLMSGGAATLCSLTLINTTSTLQYFRIYDAVSSPTCSSATGFTGISIPVPASNTGAGVSPDLGPFGWAFTNGVAFCITGGPGSSDNTSATTGIFVIASYK